MKIIDKLFRVLRALVWKLATDQSGQLVFDVVEPRELLGFVRGIVLEAEANRFRLSQVLPNQNLDDIEYRFTAGDIADEDAALVRAWDAESPIGGRQGIRRIMGELPPISKKIRLGEEERIRLRSLERGNNDLIVQAIYNDAAKMARAVAARIELLRGEALYTGKLEINENGVRQTVDFGRDAGHTVSAGTVWSNPAAAIIDDLTSWVETYTDTNGVPPGLILTSRRVVGYMLRNTQIRTLSASLSGTPDLVTRAAVNNALAAFDLPPMATYDVNVRVGGVATRVIPSDRVLLLPAPGSPAGGTLFGITAEALELLDARQIGGEDAPGVVSVIDKTFDPVATWTKAGATALPILGEPDLTFAADVL